MKILAIDPGNQDSGYCVMDEQYKPLQHGKERNADLIRMIYNGDLAADRCIIEMVASYGMPVGKEVFDTCVWIGRFMQAAEDAIGDEMTDRIYRIEEKQCICHDSRAKDANIRKALIDRFADHDMKNGKGTKKDPDWFYGFAADEWAAYAVGVTWLEKQKERENGKG